MAFAAIFLPPLTAQYLFSVSMACTDTSLTHTHTNIPHTYTCTQAELDSSLGRVREGH